MDFCSGRSNLSAAGLYVWVYEEHSSYRCSLSRMVLTIKGATFPFSCLLSLSPLSVPYLTLFGWYSPVLKKGTFSPHVLTPPLAHRHTRQAKIEVVCPWACITSFFFFFFFIAPFSLSPTSRPLCFSCFCFFFVFSPYPLPCSVTLVSPYSHVYTVETGDPPRWGNGPDLPSAWHVCLLRLQCRNVPLPLVLWGWVSVVCQLEMTHSSCLGQKWICRDVSVCFACAVDPDGLHLAIQNKKEEVEIKYRVLCWVSTVLAVLQIKRHLCI